jgi:hypothetical protein
VEYDPEELNQLLLKTGFEIMQANGVCEMPSTLATGEFYYEDFMYGSQITDGLNSIL